MAEQAALGAVLLSTLSPDAAVRRQAERDLTQAQSHPSFGPLVLQLAQDASQQKPVRQSAALSFKNWIKANWAVSRRRDRVALPLIVVQLWSAVRGGQFDWTGAILTSLTLRSSKMRRRRCRPRPPSRSSSRSSPS